MSNKEIIEKLEEIRRELDKRILSTAISRERDGYTNANVKIYSAIKDMEESSLVKN